MYSESAMTLIIKPMNFSVFNFVPFPDLNAFWHLAQQTTFENSVEIGEIASNKSFLLFQKYFPTLYHNLTHLDLLRADVSNKILPGK